MSTLQPLTISPPGTTTGTPPTVPLHCRPSAIPCADHSSTPTSTPSDLSAPSVPFDLSAPTSTPTPTSSTTNPAESITHSAPPNINIEDQLLEALIAPITGQSPSPIHLARKFNISLTRVLDFIAAPQTRARVAAAMAASDLALHQRAQTARLRAIDTLEELLDSAETPVEQRRAATALLRGPSKPTSRAFAFNAHDKPVDNDDIAPSKPIRGRPFSPHPSHSPQNIVATLVDRLLDNDNPLPNSGLHSVHNLSKLTPWTDSAENRPKDRERYLANPGPDQLLVGATSAILHPPQQQTNEVFPPNHPDQYTKPEDRFTQTVLFRYPDLTSHTATFHLHRVTQDNPYRITQWFLSRIEHHFNEDDEDDDSS